MNYAQTFSFGHVPAEKIDEYLFFACLKTYDQYHDETLLKVNQGMV
jgi:hypothetical protein